MRREYLRREFLKYAASSLALGELAKRALAAEGPAPAAGQKPNIVYILADDLGYGDVRCFNSASKIKTPNIDRIATQGVMCRDAHSGSAVCSPTRYGLMTGRYCWRSPLKFGVLYSYDAPLIEQERLTVAELLRRHGYATACVGKWHLGWTWQTTDGKKAAPENTIYTAPITNGPTQRGFDYYFGIPASLDMIPYLYVENGRVVSPPTEHIDEHERPEFFRGGPIAPGFRHDEVLPTLTRKATDWINQQAKTAKEKPFFLYLPLSSPHAPISPSNAFRGKSELGVYGDFVMETDWAVGEVLAALEQNGLTDNTLVIFTSDNGPANVADLEYLKSLGHESAHTLRGRKGLVWEAGHRVPFVAQWPGKIPPGSTCEDVMWHGDFMATAAEIISATLPPEAGVDSVSFLPAVLGQPHAPRPAVVHHSSDGYFAIREGKWKLALCSDSGNWKDELAAVRAGKPRVQLYDLVVDPGEQSNAQDSYPEVVERLKKLLKQYVAEGRSTPGPRQPNTEPVSIGGVKPAA